MSSGQILVSADQIIIWWHTLSLLTYLNKIVEFGPQPSFFSRDVQIAGFIRGGHHHHHQNDYKNGYISFHLKVQDMIISRKKQNSNIVKKYRDWFATDFRTHECTFQFLGHTPCLTVEIIWDDFSGSAVHWPVNLFDNCATTLRETSKNVEIKVHALIYFMMITWL